MTREEILSIDGVDKAEKYGYTEFYYKNVNFVLDNGENTVNGIYNSEDEYTPIKPISDLETLKQFLSFFEL